MAELIGNGVKSVATGKEVDWNAARLETDGYIDDISKGFGVPFENVANLFNAVARRVCITVNGKYLGEYQSLKLTTDPDKYSKDYYDLLYGASKNDRKAYEAMYADMVEKWGFDADKVKTAMETRMKREQGVEHSSDLERRYLSPEQESAWDDAYGTISESQAWSAASDEQRKAAADDLYDLIVGNSAGAAMQEKIDGGAAYGIDEADYVLYRLALHIADMPNDSGNLGTYTNNEVAAAIDMLSGLSNEARSYLWEAQGKSEKNNPWK